jgi:RNA polymerase sigma-70 factor (ECF subfamily)
MRNLVIFNRLTLARGLLAGVFLLDSAVEFDFPTLLQDYSYLRHTGLVFSFAASLLSEPVPLKSEEVLIHDALHGNSQAYGQLVERYQDRLFNAMVQIVGSHDEAEDVVQDSFVQAYIKLDTFQGNSRFFTWLYRIAFNNALSRQRRKRNDLSIEQSREITGSDPEDHGEAPDEHLLREERVTLVQTALSKLTAQHRAILVLREMQDTSYEDIAEILGINIGTVRSRLSRARSQLKACLEALQHPG